MFVVKKGIRQNNLIKINSGMILVALHKTILLHKNQPNRAYHNSVKRAIPKTTI
jgi:hypothetical protein